MPTNTPHRSNLPRRAVFLYLIPILFSMGALAFALTDLWEMFSNPHASHYHLPDDWGVIFVALIVGGLSVAAFASAIRETYFALPRAIQQVNLKMLFRNHLSDLAVIIFISACFGEWAWNYYRFLAPFLTPAPSGDVDYGSWALGFFFLGSYVLALACLCHEDEPVKEE